jgi:hypothetical protein
MKNFSEISESIGKLLDRLPPGIKAAVLVLLVWGAANAGIFGVAHNIGGDFLEKASDGSLIVYLAALAIFMMAIGSAAVGALAGLLAPSPASRSQT